MKLSIILISYDMAREIPRTLQSLARDYQHGAANLEYEVLLMDNGSPVPLDESTWSHVDVPVRLIRLENASPSPARAINRAFAESSGEIICLMIDGAHILTPGVFRQALAGIAGYKPALVATRYFWLGPEEQNESALYGYNQEVEDRLIKHIEWPKDGYRLFDIGTPILFDAEQIGWMNKLFESNCLFMNRSVFEEIGGANEKFVSSGGGLINSDIYRQAVELPHVTPVQIIGEGSFHQYHGGTTTNVTLAERDARVERFREEYRKIRGHDVLMSFRAFHYVGHLPTESSKIHRKKRKTFDRIMALVGMQRPATNQRKDTQF